MRLTLVRHGEAAPAVDGIDEKRELTERGCLQAEQTGKYLSELVKPDIFVVSPLVRAQQTLSYIQKFFPDTEVLICDKIKPDDLAKDAIDWLSFLPHENIIVVCHMNVVAHIAELLVTENFNPYALAEARIYEQNVIAAGLSTQVKSFIPTV